MSVHQCGKLIYHCDRDANTVHLEQDGEFYCHGRIHDKANDIVHTSIPDIYPRLTIPERHCPNPTNHDAMYNLPQPHPIIT